MIILFVHSSSLLSLHELVAEKISHAIHQTRAIHDWTALYCPHDKPFTCEELTEWREILSPFSVDVIQVDALLQSSQPAQFVFDMDSTIIKQEVIDELARAYGKYEEISNVTREAMEGNLDFAQALRKRCALLNGLPLHTFDSVYDSLELNDGVKELLHTLKTRNAVTCIFSGGFKNILHRFQQDYGITEVRANELEAVEGLLTGDVVGEIIGKEQKRDALLYIQNQYGISQDQTVAVGDGANDALMLQAATIGIAYHAKDGLKKIIPNWIDFAPMYVLEALFDS